MSTKTWLTPWTWWILGGSLLVPMNAPDASLAVITAQCERAVVTETCSCRWWWLTWTRRCATCIISFDVCLSIIVWWDLSSDLRSLACQIWAQSLVAIVNTAVLCIYQHQHDMRTCMYITSPDTPAVRNDKCIGTLSYRWLSLLKLPQLII